MRTKTVTMALLAVAVMLSVPFISSAYAYSSSGSGEADLEAQYTVVDLFKGDSSVTSFVNKDIKYSATKGTYLKGDVSDGLSLKFYGNTSDRYLVFVAVDSNESVMIGKTVRFTIDGYFLDVPVNGSAVLTEKSYVPTAEGTRITLKASLPEIKTTEEKAELEFGDIYFAMVKVTATDSEGNISAYDGIGSTVISTNNMVKVKIVDIKDSEDVQVAIVGENKTELAPDGNIAIRGNTDQGDNTLYKIIPESESSKSVLITYDGKTDTNITDGGDKVNLTIKIPANVKFYLKVTLRGTAFWEQNDLTFKIGNMSSVTASGGASLLSDTNRYVYGTATSGGVTTNVDCGANFNDRWILSGDDGMTILVTGKRVDDNRDLQLRIFMESV